MRILCGLNDRHIQTVSHSTCIMHINRDLFIIMFPDGEDKSKAMWGCHSFRALNRIPIQACVGFPESDFFFYALSNWLTHHCSCEEKRLRLRRGNCKGCCDFALVQIHNGGGLLTARSLGTTSRVGWSLPLTPCISASSVESLSAPWPHHSEPYCEFPASPISSDSNCCLVNHANSQRSRVVSFNHFSSPSTQHSAWYMAGCLRPFGLL